MTVQPMLGNKLQGQVQNTMVPLPAQAGGATTFNPNAQPQVPPTGLIGSEQALTGALGQSQNILGSSMNAGLNVLGAGAGQAQNVLGSAAKNVAAPQSFSTGTGGINNAINQGVGAMDPYTQFGGDAAQVQAARSGALGPEAQAAAMAAYQNSPYVDQAQQNAERAILRNSAVTGSTGSGRTLDQLFQNAAGMFMNDYQNQFNNLGQVTNTGLTAAGQVSNLRGQQAGLTASLQQADMASKTQQQIAGQQIKANLQSQLADAAMTAGIQGAGLITQTGGLMSNDVMNTGFQLGAGRTNAGNAMAQNAMQASAGISNLLNQQGIAVSDMVAKDISTITDMIYQSGMQDSLSSQNLAAILANIAGGQASTVAQGQAAIGAANAAGTLGINNAIQSGLEQYTANKNAQQQQPQQQPYGRNNQPVTTINTGSQYGGYV